MATPHMFTEGENPILRVCRLGDLSILEKLLSSYREPVYCCGHSSQSAWDYDTDSDDDDDDENDDHLDEDDEDDNVDDDESDSGWSYDGGRGKRSTVIYVKPRHDDNDRLKRVDSIQGLSSPYSSSFAQQHRQQKHDQNSINYPQHSRQPSRSITIAATTTPTISTAQPSPTSTTTTAITTGTATTQPCSCALPPLPTPDAMLISAIRGSQADIVDYILTEFFTTTSPTTSAFPSHTSIPHYHTHNQHGHGQNQSHRRNHKSKSKQSVYSAFPSPPSSASTSHSSIPNSSPYSPKQNNKTPSTIPYGALWELLFHPELSVLEVLRQKCPEIVSYEFAQERGHSFLHEALRRAGGSLVFGRGPSSSSREGAGEQGQGLRSLPHARLVHYLLDFGARVDTDLLPRGGQQQQQEGAGRQKEGEGTLLTALKSRQPPIVLEKCLDKGCRVTLGVLEWCAERGDTRALGLLLGKRRRPDEKEVGDEDMMGVVWRCCSSINGSAGVKEAARMLEVYVGERRLRSRGIGMMGMRGMGRISKVWAGKSGGGGGNTPVLSRGNSFSSSKVGTVKRKVLGKMMRISATATPTAVALDLPEQQEAGPEEQVYTKPAPRVLRSKAPGFLKLAGQDTDEEDEEERARDDTGRQLVNTDQLERGLGLQDLRQGYDPVTLAYLTGEYRHKRRSHHVGGTKLRNRRHQSSSWLRDSYSSFSSSSEEEILRREDEDCPEYPDGGGSIISAEDDFDDGDDDEDEVYHRRQRQEMLRITRAKLLRAAPHASISPLSLTR